MTRPHTPCSDAHPTFNARQWGQCSACWHLPSKSAAQHMQPSLLSAHRCDARLLHTSMRWTIVEVSTVMFGRVCARLTKSAVVGAPCAHVAGSHCPVDLEDKATKHESRCSCYPRDKPRPSAVCQSLPAIRKLTSAPAVAMLGGCRTIPESPAPRCSGPRPRCPAVNGVKAAVKSSRFISNGKHMQCLAGQTGMAWQSARGMSAIDRSLGRQSLVCGEGACLGASCVEQGMHCALRYQEGVLHGMTDASCVRLSAARTHMQCSMQPDGWAVNSSMS
jgi:hypothetical protein